MCFEAHHLIAGKLFWKIRYFASSVNNVHWNDQFWANFELEKVIFPILCKNLKVFVFLGKISNSSKACERWTKDCLYLCRLNTISELLIQSFFIISIMNLSLSLPHFQPFIKLIDKIEAANQGFIHLKIRWKHFCVKLFAKRSWNEQATWQKEMNNGINPRVKR